MRAYRFETFGGLDGLRVREEADPKPQRGEVLVRVRAVSLNYRDIAIPLGRYPRKAVPGLVPVSDAAGDVVEIGAGVEAFAVGDRVMGAFHPRWFGGEMPSTIQTDSYGAESDGWLCDLKVVSQEAVVRLPDTLSYEEGSTLPCAGLTAWTALTGSAPIRAGHTVLVMGSGGVSLFALQLARAVGAVVIATTSSAAKADRLKALGAAEIVNYADDPDWGKTVRALTGGRGVDRIVEVGGARHHRPVPQGCSAGRRDRFDRLPEYRQSRHRLLRAQEEWRELPQHHRRRPRRAAGPRPRRRGDRFEADHRPGLRLRSGQGGLQPSRERRTFGKGRDPRGLRRSDGRSHGGLHVDSVNVAAQG